MTRKNLQPLRYDVTGKDFAWQDISIGFVLNNELYVIVFGRMLFKMSLFYCIFIRPDKDQQQYIDVPRRPTEWTFNAYSMHSELGFGFIKEPIKVINCIICKEFIFKMPLPTSSALLRDCVGEGRNPTDC